MAPAAGPCSEPSLGGGATAPAAKRSNLGVGGMSFLACRSKPHNTEWADQVKKAGDKVEPCRNRCWSCHTRWQLGFQYLSWESYAALMATEDLCPSLFWFIFRQPSKKTQSPTPIWVGGRDPRRAILKGTIRGRFWRAFFGNPGHRNPGTGFLEVLGDS